MSSISAEQKTKRSSQYIDNLSFDETYDQAAVEILGEDNANATLKRLQADASGFLKVNIAAGGSSGGTSMVDDAGFTVGTTPINPVGGTYRSVRDAVDDNDGGALAMTAKRGLYATLETPLADSVMDDTLDTVKVSQATAANLNMTEASAAAIKTAVEALDNAADTTNNLLTAQIKPIAVSTYSYTRFVDLGANATANVKASAGNVFSLWCQNENTSDRYIQLHNTATTPAGGAVPLYTFLISGGDQIVIGTDFFGPAGANFTTGIAFAFSTTKDTYTAGTASEQSTIVMFI